MSVAGALALGFIVLGAPPAEPATTTVRIRPVVAELDGRPVVDRPWLEAQIARANAVFAPYHLQFVLAPTEALLGPMDAMTRRDRDALSAHVAPEVVNWFVVGTLMDIHESGRKRRGVHWRNRERGTRYVIMASYASTGILAHELGHYFGNPQHRHVPGNLMSYVPGVGLPTLDPDQVKRLRRTLRRSLRSGELVAVSTAMTEPATPGHPPR